MVAHTLAMSSGVCPNASKISMDDGMYTSLKYLTVSASAPGYSILATSCIIFVSNSVCTGPGSIIDSLGVQRECYIRTEALFNVNKMDYKKPVDTKSDKRTLSLINQSMNLENKSQNWPFSRIKLYFDNIQMPSHIG